jgi:hypothetical protein
VRAWHHGGGLCVTLDLATPYKITPPPPSPPMHAVAKTARMSDDFTKKILKERSVGITKGLAVRDERTVVLPVMIDIPPPQQETDLDINAFLLACKIELIASTINTNLTEIICARFSMRPASVLVVGLVIMLIVQTGANMDPSGAITNYILYGTKLSPKHFLCQFGLASFLGSALGAIAARSYLHGFDGFKGPPSTDAPPKQAETPTKKGVVYSSPSKSKSKKVD